MSKQPDPLYPSAPSDSDADSLKAGRWRQLSGLLLTLLTIAAIECLSHWSFRIPNPLAVLPLVVVFSAYTGGLRAGLLSSALAWLYVAYFFLTPHQLLHGPADNVRRILVGAVSLPALALMTGGLKSRAQRISEEALRRERAYSASLMSALTERKRAEETLRESEARFRKIFDEGPVGMALVDLDYRLVKVNKALCQMLGYSEPELTARSILDITHPEDLDQDMQLAQDVFRGEVPGRRIEKRFLKKDKDLCWAALTAILIRDQSGHGLYGLEIIESITERKRAEAALREARARLEAKVAERTRELTQAKGELEKLVQELEQRRQETEDFIYAVAHDLKTPLISIQGFSSELRREFADQLGENGNFYLDRLVANAGRIERLVRDLLDVSRAARSDAALEEVHLAGLLESVLSSLDYEIQAKGIEVVVPKEWPRLLANHDQVKQVFGNLISNAINYMGSQPHPRVALYCGEDPATSQWLFYVQDNGIGIPPEHHQKIFNIFERLPEGKQANPKGTGIGLTIVKKIIEFHGGNIWLESEIGRGATFYFTWPKKLKSDQ